MAKAPNDFARILPFPVAPVLWSECLLTAEGSVYRAVTMLAFNYWLSGCRELPTDNTARAAIIRIPQAHMKPIKPKVDAALAEILPMLKAHYDAAFKTKATRTAMAQFASHHAAHVGRRSGQAVMPPQFQPRKATPHENPRADIEARSAATQRSSRSQQRNMSGLLSEATVRGR